MPATADAATGAPGASSDTTVGKPLSLKKPAKTAKVKPHHAAKHASAQHAKLKSSAAAVNTADAEDGAALPAKVANANAEMPAAAEDMPGTLLAQAEAVRQDAAKAAPAQPAGAEVVAPDQLNDLDLAARVEQAPAPAETVTVGKTGETATQIGNDNSLWGNTSLIGKIFIAFGGLLTVASAARMFIA
ncbi:MAG TPA: hypothetical protein VGC77_05360 [Rhodopseudomonas sp.]|uniref:hypothetical protein n=1 Tax=Rhodopseudomonas sp. TaxID=1078 RepID=UPI002ED878B7